MMAPEPLRSATAVGGAEDTSLALPSDDKLRTGQQRVLDQVHTIKRSKSKQGRSGSPSASPTSLTPQTLTTYTEFGSFRFSPSKTNGTFSRTSSTMSTGYHKAMTAQKSRTLSARTMGGRHFSTSATLEQQINTSKLGQTPNGLKPSRSDPALARPLYSASAPNMRAKGQSQQTLQTRVNRQSIHSITNGTQMTNSQTRMVRPLSTQFVTDGKMGTMKTSKTELQQSVGNNSLNISDLTLKDAVEFLSHSDENYQQCGAIFIQHTTFKEERAKQEVYQLGGIPILVTLLRSSNPEVSQAAAGALRNLVFRNQENKIEVQRCGGIAKALQLLKETDSTETQKQITGLLWNLSSADELKGELTATALPALTENVVVPYTSWSENTTNNNIHPDVFFNATGCLRNLSCSQKKERKAMRECPGLIDSIMSYVQSCVAEENPDDMSVENCTCILHNLTYQLESESPECFSKFFPKVENQVGNKSPTIGCFSPKSSKVQKQFSFNAARAIPEDGPASGVDWLCHPKAMQTYLSLLSMSQKDATLEACCGALQNLTASKEQGSIAMSQILVQKMGALMHMPPLLKSPNLTLQKTSLSLLANMSRTSSVQSTIAKQILPELTKLLYAGPREMGNSDDTVASVCNTTQTLMLANADVSKKVISNELVSTLADLSENRSFPKSNKAASLLLYSLWNEKNLQGFIKKLGMPKASFVNDHTTAVQKSFQV